MAERARNSMYQRPEWDNRLMTHTQPPARPWSLRNALQDAALRGTAMNVAALSELAGGGVPDPRVYAPGAGMLPSPIGDVAGLGQDASMYLRDPESRTLGNLGMSLAAGILPLVPAPAALKQGLKSDPGYYYHATNAERLGDIAESGKLKVHKPGDFTDQDMWPDGSVKKRAYFGDSAGSLWQFAPEEGQPAILRVKRDVGKFGVESYTRDIYTESPIPAKLIEYLGDDGNWHPLIKGKK